ncbi:hypothetical protein BDN70DRAFT_888895 [Pholiota conissans]|uniref:Uncharacterized protein n=1 Tax=Pholiota conissans TaxID=109636 RepID=A0A9P5YKV9_9AGAR|nr:hypothetical protein BDN70DRAFT_888895 [Pholiota conissans]
MRTRSHSSNPYAYAFALVQPVYIHAWGMLSLYAQSNPSQRQCRTDEIVSEGIVHDNPGGLTMAGPCALPRCDDVAARTDPPHPLSLHSPNPPACSHHMHAPN